MTDLSTLNNTLQAYTSDHQQMMDDLNAAKNNANTAAANAESLQDPNKAANRIYVNANTGDDAAAGNPATPVKTFVEALKRVKALVPNTIYLLTDVALDERVNVNVNLPSLNIVGWSDNGYVSRKITILDDKGGGAWPGQLQINRIFMTLDLYQVDIELASQFAAAALFLDHSFVLLGVRNCDLTKTATNQSSLIDKSFADSSFLNMVVSLFTPNDCGGNIILGEPAGTVIDDLYWVNSNLLSL